MKSHTVGAHLESLAGCFVGCEQIVTWLKSWPGGCRRADIWFKVKMDNSGNFFCYFASHFLIKVCRCRANIHKYYQFDPRTSRARVVHLHFVCVCVCVCLSICMCVCLNEHWARVPHLFMDELWRPREQRWMQHWLQRWQLQSERSC